MDRETLRWEDWDWRPLARCLVWLALAFAWASERGFLTEAALRHVMRELVLGWLLSFGILTYVQALIVTSAWRLALGLDELAFTLCERLVRPAVGRASFLRAFLAAFSLELALVLVAARLLAGVRL